MPQTLMTQPVPVIFGLKQPMRVAANSLLCLPELNLRLCPLSKSLGL
jgi:hypothetical protein